MAVSPLNSIAVAIAGHACLDLRMPFKGLPERGGLVLVDSAQIGVGGPAAASAVAASHLGSTVRYVGAIGRDPLGQALLDLMKASGINTDYVIRRGAGSATAALIDTDERSFLHCKGVNAEFTADMVETAALQSCWGLHIAGVGLLDSLHGEPCAALLKQARKLGLLTSLDTVHPGEMDPGAAAWMIEPALPHLDLLSISLAETRYFTGTNDPDAFVKILGPKLSGVLMVKMGKNGVLMAKAGDTCRIPAYAVKARDTTGAGDAAAVSAFLQLVGGDSWMGAGLFACAVGGIVAEKGQGAHGVPHFDEVADFIAHRLERRAEVK
jgi:sugar/nucleoside kinase (ribokinase family)